MPNSGRKPRGQNRSRTSTGGPRIENFERWLFRATGKVLFLFIFCAFIFIGMTHDLLFIVALAGIAVFLWGAVIFPTQEFKQTGQYLWSGRAGEDVHSLWCRILPWRGGGRR